MIGLEQLRPTVEGSPVVMGGQSFTRFELHDVATRRHGLEGALLDAARVITTKPPGRAERVFVRATKEDPQGMRRLVSRLHLSSRDPAGSVTDHCRAELIAAGLTTRDAAEALESRLVQISRARDENRERRAELEHAILRDCLHVLSSAHHKNH